MREAQREHMAVGFSPQHQQGDILATICSINALSGVLSGFRHDF
jgi:hypothetical protein